MWILSRIEDWDESLPIALVAPSATISDRRSLLLGLAGKVLHRSLGAADIVHRTGEPPRLRGAGRDHLHLSSASRGGLAAVAVAATPIGIDIEAVSGGLDLPWNVLHPAEQSALRGIPGAQRDRAFARLWSCKEAYLKALGTGSSREPASFSVEMMDAASPRLTDTSPRARPCELVSTWVESEGRQYAVTAVLVR
ncbi:MAG: 4-phosphopantetheinyl transferase superfamily protein [Enterovirga sp.]|nr:4-phosphopantetheinyl transferase superfamily protein [Enterovirga sp.]